MIEARVRIEDFVDDRPYAVTAPPAPTPFAGGIDGVVVTPLEPRADGRGRLVVLMTTPDGPVAGPEAPLVHVYHVHAEPGSIRAWVFHRRQDDRLAFEDGAFRIVLIDLREGSPTHRQRQVIEAGEANPVRVTIPPLVVHGVRNVGPGMASFVNMPTRAFDLRAPDKARLPYGHPSIDYRFD